MRTLALTLVALLLVAACAPSPAAESPTAQRTPDVKRSKLDLIYTQLASVDVHRATSRQILTGGLEAVRAEVRSAGGADGVGQIEFSDATEATLADFDRFIRAVAGLAAKNPGLSPERIAQSAILGMIRSTPDCHTYYIDASGRGYDSRPEAPRGTPNPPAPSGATISGPPDEAGLEAKLLDGGVAWIRFKAFTIHGTYDIRDKVRKVLDAGLAAGARAWLFDLRGNVGGNGDQYMASWFLNGEPAVKFVYRDGSGVPTTANKDLRLPAAYQLPIAIVLNDRGGSAPEVFTLALRENKRALIVGRRSVGCLGSTGGTSLSDGSRIFVVSQEFAGAVTGARYNNVGIPPDIEADDASAVEVAARALRGQIAAGR